MEDRGYTSLLQCFQTWLTTLSQLQIHYSFTQYPEYYLNITQFASGSQAFYYKRNGARLSKESQVRVQEWKSVYIVAQENATVAVQKNRQAYKW